MSDFYYKYRNLFEDDQDIPYTHILNLYTKPQDLKLNTLVSTLETSNLKGFKPKLKNPVPEPFPSILKIEENSNKNKNEPKIQNIYDLFYQQNDYHNNQISKNETMKNDLQIFKKDPENLKNILQNLKNEPQILNTKENQIFKKDLTIPQNRPNSMKESFNDLKEVNKINRFSNKKTLERVGQQILNPMNSVNDGENSDYKQITPNNLKTPNIYDNFNQKLGQLDKMKKKYDLQRNFDDKKLISRYSEPIYIYNDDIDRYKKSLERRVLASSNNDRKERLRKLLKEEIL